MSYSFNVKAASKAEAKLKIAAELDKVVASQSVHAKDRDQAQAAAHAFVDVLDDDEAKDVSVSVNGWLSGNWAGNDLASFTGACVGVTASLVAKQTST